MGLMGYQTPNIDRIAKEGMMFTDYYAENSCTAGRSIFITGQMPPAHRACPRSAFPARTVGLQDRDITIAQALKPLGYATGQFGKNHLGDRDEFLPTMHGFDEFFGNLYHLNAEEEPEQPDYPKDDTAFARPIRRAACFKPPPTARSRIPARSTTSGWRRSTTRRPPPRSTSWSGRPRPRSRSSPG